MVSFIRVRDFDSAISAEKKGGVEPSRAHEEVVAQMNRFAMICVKLGKYSMVRAQT